LEYETPDDTGYSKRARLQHAIDAAPEFSQGAQAELDSLPYPPACLDHLVIWFWGLHGGRTQNMNGPNPITFQDIMAWKNLHKIEIYGYEIDIIKRLDRAYLSYVAKQQAKKNKKK